MNRFKLFLFNTVILTVTSILIRAIDMFFSVYVANKIGSEGSGLFELIMSIYLFATTIANAGISLAATRIVAEEVDTNSSCGVTIAMRKCIFYSLFFGVLAAIILFLCTPFLVSNLLMNKISTKPLYILAVSLPFVSITTSLSGYFSGVRKVSKSSFIRTSSLFIRVGLTCLFIYVFPANNIDLVCSFLVLSSTIASIFEFLFSYILYYIDKKKLCTTNMRNNNYLSKILKISLPVAVTSIIRSGLSTLKQSLIPIRLEKFTHSSDLAFSQYGLINGMTFPLLMFPSVFINSFAGLLIPEFANFKLNNNYSTMNRIICFIFKIASVFSICMIGIFLTFTEEICTIVYHNLETVEFVVLLCPIIIFMYLDTIIDSMLKGLDRQVEVMYCNIADLFITITLIYSFIPIYGIYGYILILYTSEIFNFCVSLYQLYKETHFHFDYVFCVILPLLLILIIKFAFDTFDYYLTSRKLIVMIKIIVFIFVYLLLILFAELFKLRKSDKFTYCKSTYNSSKYNK